MSPNSSALTGAFSAVIFLICTPALADYCAEQSDPAAYSPNFAPISPVFSDEATGFLYVEEDLLTQTALSSTEASLLKLITTTLEQSGTKLAVVIPAPRITTFEGLETVDRELILNVGQSYNFLVDQLRGIGIVAPNVLEWVQEHSKDIDLYNLPQDNHWSPVGALDSALSLREQLDKTGFFELIQLGEVFEITGEESFSNIGSFAKALEDVCDIQPITVTLEKPSIKPVDVSSNSSDLLFGNVESNFDVGLIGTSFSNGGNRDNFDWTDAVRYALQSDVENYAIGGGGVESAFLSFALARPIEEYPDFLVWEIPWVNRAGDWTNRLRLIYGAMFGSCNQSGMQRSIEATIDPAAQWTTLFEGLALQDMISFEIPGLETGRVVFEVTYSDGQVVRIDANRSDRILNALDYPEWTVYLANPELPGFEGNPVSVSISIPNQQMAMPISATVCSALC